MNKLKLLGWMIPFFKPYTIILSLIGVIAIISTGLSLSYPFLSKVLIDDVLIEPKYELTTILSIGIGIVMIGQILQAINGYIYLKITLKISKALRVYLFERVERIHFDFFVKTKVGDITTRINGDLNEIQRVMTDGILGFLSNIITFLFITCMLLWLDWKLFLISLLFIPILLVSIFYFRPRIVANTRKIREGHSEVMGQMIDTLSRIRLIKLSNAENNQAKKLGEKIENLNKSSLKFSIIQHVAEGIPRSAIALSTGLVLFIGGNAVLANTLTIGSLLAFTTYLGRFFSPVQSFAGMYISIQRALVSAERINEYLTLRKDEESNSLMNDQINETKQIICFKNVSYVLANGKAVMEDVSIALTKQSITALVGESGIGKSTFIHSLVRLNTIKQGAIYFNGKNIEGISTQEIRRKIQIVSQDNEILNDTIFENLLLGFSEIERQQISVSKIMKVCEIVGIHDHIQSLVEKYETKVEESGRNLSGGQKQRIAIARALLKEPELLVLDEATSGLDQISERLLFKELEQWVKTKESRALLIITHRLESIHWVDNILIFEDGKINQSLLKQASKEVKL